MKILQVNNFFRHSGGETTAVNHEKNLLQNSGHHLRLFGVTNDWVGGIWKKIVTALNVTYSTSSKADLRAEIDNFLPDVVHIHNFFPMLTPSVFDACQDAGVPVVHTLHNYRLICPSSLLWRDGNVCEDCITGSVYKCVIHGCYRHSRLGTLAIAHMVDVHQRRGTWKKKINCFIALTDFARKKFIQAGLPEEKISVKPNFVYDDPGMGEGKGGYAVSVGLLSPAKGLKTLLTAWKKLGKNITLKIVGNMPAIPVIGDTGVGNIPGVEFLGYQPNEKVLQLMKEAAFLVFPSESYEGFPLAIAEAFAAGTPVVASNLGAMASIIEHDRTGLLFGPGNHEELIAAIERLIARPHILKQMRNAARAEYDAKYSAERNYGILINIYNQVLKNTK